MSKRSGKTFLNIIKLKLYHLINKDKKVFFVYNKIKICFELKSISMGKFSNKTVSFP